MSPTPVPRDDTESVFDEYEDDDEDKRVVPDVEDTVDATGKLLNQRPAYDRIINTEVALQLEEEVTTGKVTRRALGRWRITQGSVRVTTVILRDCQRELRLILSTLSLKSP